MTRLRAAAVVAGIGLAAFAAETARLRWRDRRRAARAAREA